MNENETAKIKRELWCGATELVELAVKKRREEEEIVEENERVRKYVEKDDRKKESCCIRATRTSICTSFRGYDRFFHRSGFTSMVHDSIGNIFNNCVSLE